MPTPIVQGLAPYAVPQDETNLDTTTAVDGNVNVTITLQMTGTVANVQADWATIAAVNLVSPSAVMSVGPPD